MKKSNINTLFMLISFNMVAFSQAHELEKPSAYAGLNDSSYHLIELVRTKSDQLSFVVDNQTVIVPWNQDKNTQDNHYIHQNTSHGHLSATVGKNSLFGQLHLKEKNYIITTNNSGIWAVELPPSGISFNECGVEHQNQVKPNKLNFNQLDQPLNKNAGTIVDVLMIYDQAIADRYPGDLLQTRVAQYFNVSNQTYANSEIDLAIRQVGLEQVGYDFNDANINARNLLQQILTIGVGVNGFENVPQLRDQTGADLVIFLRTHDIETRGNCGIAYFPVGSGNNLDDTYGINIMADGMSSWSICTDQLMVHEIGHNLSAGHHNWNPTEFGYPADAKGFAKLGQFGTVMGSFGTGTVDRFLELNYFSNPNIQCGGGPCGIAGDANNVNVINQLKGPVSQYRNSISDAPLPADFTAAFNDLDNDGVIDRDDEFPHDPSETTDSDRDGIGDVADAFPNLFTEQFDFDEDGIGNNADNDDDADGILDFEDDFPLNPNEVKDSDQDGVGDIADQFVFERSENLDSDSDGIGNNEDQDDDNDGAADIDELKQDLLVVSAGNNRILRFDAQTGMAKGIEVLPTDGLLTFQSDIAVDVRTQTMYYTTSSSVKKRDLLNRDRQSELLIPAYSDQQAQLGTGFPTALALNANSGALVVGKLRRTTVDAYDYNNRNNIIQFSMGALGQTEEESIVDFYYDPTTNNGTNYIYALGQSSRVYRAQADIFNLPDIIDFELVGLGGINALVEPFAMVNYPTEFANTLIHTDQARNTLVMTNGITGSFEGLFANLNDIGYSKPTGIALTDDGRLLVAVADQNAIIAFDVFSRTFLGELVKDMGLDQPHKIALAPQILDRFSQDKDKIIRPNAGNWFNPDSSGRGFNVGIFNNRLQILWFTYDDQGSPIWYQTAGLLDGLTYVAEILKTTRLANNEIEVSSIGNIIVEFYNEREARYNWQIGDDSGAEDIQWFQFSLEPETENYTGMWTRPDAPGWGLTLSTVGDVSVAIPFIYDDEGEPRWSISAATDQLQPFELDMFSVFSDTLCPTCSGEPISETVPSGSILLNLGNTSDWSSDLNWADPIPGGWNLENTEIIRISSPPTRPR